MCTGAEIPAAIAAMTAAMEGGTAAAGTAAAADTAGALTLAGTGTAADAAAAGLGGGADALFGPTSAQIGILASGAPEANIPWITSPAAAPYASGGVGPGLLGDLSTSADVGLPGLGTVGDSPPGLLSQLQPYLAKANQGLKAYQGANTAINAAGLGPKPAPAMPAPVRPPGMGQPGSIYSAQQVLGARSPMAGGMPGSASSVGAAMGGGGQPGLLGLPPGLLQMLLRQQQGGM